MLIQFSVKNFKSIKEQQTLSLVGSNGSELQDTNTLSVLNGKLSLVRSATIYGPNASGKSSLIQALEAMKIIVKISATQNRGDTLPIIPYLFDEETAQQPTEFSIVFINDNVRYEYGFIASAEQVFEEWLYAFPRGNGKGQLWIEREFKDGEYKWGAMDKLSGAKHLWQESTRSNELFLSKAIQLNSQQLQPIFDWFDIKLKVITDNLTPVYTAEQLANEEEKVKILTFLQLADFHIADIDVQSEYFERERRFSKQLKITMKGEAKKIRTIHQGIQNQPIALDFKEESAGTQKFFAYIGPILDVLKNGYVLVVDELNNHLHPLLVKQLIQLFHNNELNRQQAQLILTTHDTSILSQEIFRRDQIWFTEKDQHNATTLYPLTDFHPRKDVENFESFYLQGRYGAIPFLQGFKTKVGELK